MRRHFGWDQCFISKNLAPRFCTRWLKSFEHWWSVDLKNCAGSESSLNDVAKWWWVLSREFESASTKWRTQLKKWCCLKKGLKICHKFSAEQCTSIDRWFVCSIWHLNIYYFYIDWFLTGWDISNVNKYDWLRWWNCSKIRNHCTYCSTALLLLLALMPLSLLSNPILPFSFELSAVAIPTWTRQHLQLQIHQPLHHFI